MTHLLVVSFLLFVVGVAGVLSRRNVVAILVSIELILVAANLNFVAFSRYWQAQNAVTAAEGQVFALFVVAVAAAEAVVGLAVVLAVRRSRGTLDADALDLLKW